MNVNSYLSDFNLKMAYKLTADVPGKLQKSRRMARRADARCLIKLMSMYNSRENPYIYQSPIARFIAFGQYLDHQTLEVHFGLRKVQQIKFTQSDEYSSIVSPEFFKYPCGYSPLATTTALYTYLLLLINNRTRWANKVAKILDSMLLLSKCGCGLCSAQLPHNFTIRAQANLLKHKCGCIDPQTLEQVVEQIVEEYPPPPLPCPQLILLALEQNSAVAEYLLGLKRLPDVCTMRQIIYTYGGRNDSSRYSSVNVSPNLAMSKQQARAIDAALYVSDFGHYWQADELAAQVNKLAWKLQIIEDGDVSKTLKLHYYSQAENTVLGHSVDSLLNYSALDFLNIAFREYVDTEL